MALSLRRIALCLPGISVVAIALAGCTNATQPLDRPGDVPPSFTASHDKFAPIWPAANWWGGFGAQELASLELTAQRDNLDIASAAALVLQAEANDGIALSGLFPTLGGSFGGTRSGSNTPSVATGTRAHNAFSAGLTASYQQSFFGMQFFQLEAARENLRAQRYGAAVTGLSVASQVADQFFLVISYRERFAIASTNIAAARRILAITQAKLDSGVVSNLQLAEEQAIVAQQESTLPGILESEKEARYALAILLGRAPEGFDISARAFEGIAGPAVQPGLPSELLLRNPAVAQAEAQLYAAHANVDAARASYFPLVSLTGSAGYGAEPNLSNLFNSGNLVWSIGASMLQTIFDGGRVHAQNDLALAQQTQLIAAYRKAVFTAFQDVESALGTVKSTGDQVALITAETRADTEAFRISELQYREGTIDIIALLTNQQNLFNAQQALIQSKLANLEAHIALYNALGGGWDQRADDAAYKNQLDWWPL